MRVYAVMIRDMDGNGWRVTLCQYGANAAFLQGVFRHRPAVVIPIVVPGGAD